MNDLMREHAYQSGFFSKRVFDNSFVCEPKLEAKLEKFTDAIIADVCALLYTDECRVSDLAFEDYKRKTNMIIEHFGVKE